MGGLVIHAVVYLSVNAMLVFFWLISVGSREKLDAIRTDPTTMADNDFWPIVVIVPWGVALVIHATTVIVDTLPGRRRRKRKERERRRRERADRGMTSPPAGPVPPVPPVWAARTPRPSEPVRQWTVVMFTDIARSTPLAETMGDEAWADVVAEHRDTVRGVLDDHGGAEVGTQGDGFLCRFDDPDGAVEAAIALQRTLAEQRADGSFAPEIRVGLHAGEAIDGHDDLLGNAVNLAARVMAVAEPGEILVTEPVADHLRPGRDLDDRGLVELKGITRSRHLLAVRWQDDDAAPAGDRAPADDTVVDLRDGGQTRT